MAQGTSNRVLVKGAKGALDQFKYEVAGKLGLGVQPGDNWGDLPSRQCGSVGGQMVRQLIERAERQLSH